jgi:hypothetical protein
MSAGRRFWIGLCLSTVTAAPIARMSVPNARTRTIQMPIRFVVLKLGYGCKITSGLDHTLRRKDSIRHCQKLQAEICRPAEVFASLTGRTTARVPGMRSALLSNCTSIWCPIHRHISSKKLSARQHRKHSCFATTATITAEKGILGEPNLSSE